MRPTLSYRQPLRHIQKVLQAKPIHLSVEDKANTPAPTHPPATTRAPMHCTSTCTPPSIQSHPPPTNTRPSSCPKRSALIATHYVMHPGESLSTGICLCRWMLAVRSSTVKVHSNGFTGFSRFWGSSSVCLKRSLSEQLREAGVPQRSADSDWLSSQAIAPRSHRRFW